MFIAWSDADTDWVEEIEIVSSFECKYGFNPLGGFVTVLKGKKAERCWGGELDAPVVVEQFFSNKEAKSIFLFNNNS